MKHLVRPASEFRWSPTVGCDRPTRIVYVSLDGDPVYWEDAGCDYPTHGVFTASDSGVWPGWWRGMDAFEAEMGP